MTVKIKDVAKAAGVSSATVSLALSNSTVIKDETKNRVKKIARELGYSPNAIARGLKRQKSGNIGLIVPDIVSPYYGELVRCIDEIARDSGYELILSVSNDKPDIEKKIIESFISARVEGVIIAPINQVNYMLGYYEQLDMHSIPYDFVTSRYLEINASYVMVDLEDGMYRLVKYLLDLGHRYIYFIAGQKDVITTSYRLKGYIKAFEERGFAFQEEYLVECGKVNYEQAREVTERLLNNNKNIDAIICINDVMATGVMNVLRERRIKVPHNISVAGYDNSIFSSVSAIPLTTVNQDIEKMSWNAVDIIMRKIKNGEDKIEKVLIKPELIIRESPGRKQ